MDIAGTAIHCGLREFPHSPLSPTAALDFVADPAFGGSALFVGRVRARNLGCDVVGVDYELFEPLALRLFRQFAEEIAADIDAPLKLYAEHVHGKLGIGDLAVVVAAGSAHRDAAFRACRALIEAIKYRAPIWKCERYADGSSQWSEGSPLQGPAP